MLVPQVLGYVGGVIAGVAYVPQITHLVSEKCTSGLSIRAFLMWDMAALFVFISALYSGVMVFQFLSFIQLIASTVIIIFTFRYRNLYCLTHTPA